MNDCGWSRRLTAGADAFSSPEPIVSWTRGQLQIKPSGSGDENSGESSSAHVWRFLRSVEDMGVSGLVSGWDPGKREGVVREAQEEREESGSSLKQQILQSKKG